MSKRHFRFGRFATLGTLATICALGTFSDDAKAQTAKGLTIPGSLSTRMNRTLTKPSTRTDGKAATPQDIANAFDPSTTVTLPSGKTITAQELVDRVGRVETSLKARNTSITSLKKSAWVLPTTSAKIATQDAQYPTAVTSMKNLAIPPMTFEKNLAAPCTASTCEPKTKEKSVTWSKELGDTDAVAAYSSISITSKHADAYSAGCSMAWDNGLYLIGNKQSLLKFTADGTANTSGSPSVTGTASLYTLGQSSAAWSKSGSFTAENASKTFTTPKASLSYTFFPGFSVSGGVQGSVTLGLTPTKQQTASSNAVECKLSVTPSLTTKVTGDVSMQIGISDLVEIASAGVKTEVVPINLKLPTTLGVSVTEDPKLTLLFQSEIDSTFLSGKLYLYYKISDVCTKVFGKEYCLVEDVLGIDTYGEYSLYKSNGYDFDTTWADVNQEISFVKK